MKFHHLASVCILAILLVLLPLASAFAGEAPLSLHLDGADAAAYPAIRVGLSVWDADGLPVTGLKPDNFTLREDGGAPFRPANVQMNNDAPLQVVLVLDVSTSMSGKPLTDAQGAAARFLDHLTSADRAALIAFSGQVNPDPAHLDPAREVAFTADFDTLYDLIDSLNAYGQTHLYNAAVKAVRLFEGQPSGHRAVLLLSDGRNEPSDVGDPEEVIRLAQEANVPFFVIGLGNAIDEPYLRRLANETGGLFRSAPTSAELAHLFTDMAALLKTQYQLEYESRLPADGGMHTLSVSVNAAGGTAAQEIAFGPLPAELATPEPANTPSVETAAAEASPAPVTEVPSVKTTAPEQTPPSGVLAASNPPAAPAESGAFLPWIIGGGLLLLAVVLGLFLRTRRSGASQAEVCAQCGFDLTGHSGACPQCGSTKRLPKFKR